MSGAKNAKLAHADGRAMWFRSAWKNTAVPTTTPRTNAARNRAGVYVNR